MATLTERLAFLISANADDAVRAFQKTGASAEKELGRAEDKIKKLGSHLTLFGAGAMAFAGVAGRGLYELAQASEDAEMQSRKLANSIANNGQYASGAQKRLEDLARATMEVTAADDDAIIGAQALMVQFGLSEQQVSTLTPLVVDLSRKMGVDMDTAAKAVAKSVDGTSTALKKMGIDVQATKDGGDAFTNTVEALRGSVGGFAEQEAETFSGKMEKLKVSLGNLAEGVGSGVVDAFGGFANVATRVSDTLGNLSPELQSGVGKVAAYATAAIGLAGALSFVAGQAVKIHGRLTDATGALNNFGKAAKWAGIALGGLALAEGIGAVFNTISDDAGNVERKLQAMTIAVGDFSKAGDDGAKVMKTFRDSVAAAGKGFSLGNLISDFGKEVKIVGGSIGRDIEDIDDAFQKLLDTSPQMAQTLLDAWQIQADALDHSSSQYKDNIDLIERYQKRIDLVSGSTKALEGASDSASGAVGDLGEATGDGAEAADEAAEAQEKFEKAINDTFDAARAAVDSEFALRDAQRDYKDALGELNTVLSDVNSTEEQRAEALDNAAQKAIDVADAELRMAEERAAASGETLTATEREQIWRESLLRTADTLDPSGQLRKNLWGVATDVKQATGDRRLTITADTSAASANIRGLKGTVDTLAPYFTGKGKDIGYATADGIERGIASGRYKVELAAAKVGAAALDAAKRALGIHSPSQVMADEVGLPISEGIAEGVADGAGLVLDALSDVGDEVSDRAADIVRDSTNEIGDVLDAAKNAFDEVLDSINKRRDQEDAARRVADAEESVAEAEEELQIALEESGRGSDNYRRAQQRLEDAQENLRDANYRLLEVSYDLIELGPAGIDTFTKIGRAAGLTREEIQKLIDKYKELLAAQQAAAKANAVQTPIDNAESDVTNKANYQADLDAAIASYQEKMAQRAKAIAAGQNPNTIENEMASLAIKASKSYALLNGYQSGTASFYKAQLDLLRYLTGNQPYLLDNLSSYIKAIEASVPGYATGGIVKKPTLAMIGEKGPEAVIPLSKMRQEPPMVVNIHVNGADPNQVVDALKRYARQNGAIPVRTMNP